MPVPDTGSMREAAGRGYQDYRLLSSGTDYQAEDRLLPTGTVHCRPFADLPHHPQHPKTTEGQLSLPLVTTDFVFDTDSKPTTGRVLFPSTVGLSMGLRQKPAGMSTSESALTQPPRLADPNSQGQPVCHWLSYAVIYRITNSTTDKIYYVS